ncbi:MAG TPA: beta-ketoacyl-ACP synthase III [Anaerolineae bacterium]|nr:beta-ketoacyl-ACP synthase III [Anaerolineae bacterium]HOQ97465.1 beta-ketoacyl-ACP synthase III [Anaerolineae bacterium]HPL29097.1 beta-ketoacyl-ACP synthase III [Anaerolineae bacterium]
MKPRAQVTGWGRCLPERIVTNEDLARVVDTSDEWIRSRTGIAARRIAAAHETTASLAIRAGRQALSIAGLPPHTLDLIIVATATPEHQFPSTACLVQDALGAAHAAAFDLSAGCTGFIYGLSVAAEMIAAGTYRSVLVIGAETLSRIVNWKDRNTCVLFGDGAGAVVLQAGSGDGGVLATTLGADGSGGDLLMIPAGGSKRPASAASVQKGEHYIQMDGREVYRFAVRIMVRAARQVTAEAGVALDDVALLVPHQANVRIIEAAIKDLGMARERVYINLQRYGNTSAASIPIALCEAVEAGRLQRGDCAVLVGFGAGLTWGAALLRWGVATPVPPVPRWRRLLHWLGYRLAALRSLGMRLARRVDAWLSEPLNGK